MPKKKQEKKSKTNLCPLISCNKHLSRDNV